MMLRLPDSRQRYHQVRQSTRTGFSLVELLVSISIFVILSVLAVSAFRDSKKDKIAAASRQVSASFGGARSRAARALEPRGIRLIKDRQDYRLSTGLQYIGQSQLFDGYLQVQINSAGVAQLMAVETGARDWEDLRNEGLLTPGAKIYLRSYSANTTNPTVDGSNNGRWYTIASTGFAPTGEDMNNNGTLDLGEDLNGSGALENEQRVQIVGPMDGATWDPVNSYWQSYPLGVPYAYHVGLSNTIPVPYLLRLSPQELPETDPINLPPGVVIDFLSSRVPPNWLQFEDANSNGVVDPGEDLNGNGFLDAVVEDLNQNGQLDPGEDFNGNNILDDVKYDIPVSPNGTVAGAISGSGPIYLYLCTRDNIDRMRAMAGYRAGLIPGDFENGLNGTVPPYGPDHPTSERKVVCIVPQTGLVYIADVNGADTINNSTGTATPDGWADDPFSFAREGREGR